MRRSAILFCLILLLRERAENMTAGWLRPDVVDVLLLLSLLEQFFV
jgi:hypothetical protein